MRVSTSWETFLGAREGGRPVSFRGSKGLSWSVWVGFFRLGAVEEEEVARRRRRGLVDLGILKGFAW